ncbi:MAG TPA: SlyX family protein [Deltaproteobacteria bacterium]|nr:SlyX family protein [Deltaproteobacteria bacterium]HQB38237.1 SlyX family protein [Deltaproteobacteria bacterium]
MEERLTDLELRFMQQEKTLQDLSDVVYRQEQQIVTLERAVLLLTQQLRSMAASTAAEADPEERPPHY